MPQNLLFFFPNNTGPICRLCLYALGSLPCNPKYESLFLKRQCTLLRWTPFCLICPLVTQCQSLMPVFLGIARYCSKVFISSVRLLTFYPSSMPLDVGDLQNHKCPLLIVGVCFHFVDFHTTFPKLSPQNQTRVCEEEKKSYDSNETKFSWSSFPKRIAERTQHPKKKSTLLYPS